MKITIQPTSFVATLRGGVQVRIWEGVTDLGVRVSLSISSVGCAEEDNLPELTELPPPSTWARAMLREGIRFAVVRTFPVVDDDC